MPADSLKRYFLSLFLLIAPIGLQHVCAQGISTEGKEFWVGFMTNWLQSNNNRPILELYISADDSTSGTVTMPRESAFPTINFEVYPNETRKLTISTTLAMAQGSNVIENKGLFIETDNTVSVYAMNKRQYSADMTVILPTYSLGNNYYVLSHWEDGNRNDNANSDAEFLIAAITDSTEVEITPAYETKGGNPAGVPFRVMLMRGQTYQVRAVGDLTGSHITATSKSGCENFAVYSGNMYTQVGECQVRNGHDHLYAQMYPTNTLGKNFIVVPLENRYGGDIIKFLATRDNTTIQTNSNTYNLDAGEFVKILSDDVLTVTSDKPISVGQYSRTMDCDGTLGDPFLIPISPNEQMLNKITFYSPSIATLSRYSLSIISKTSEVQSITFDNASIGHTFRSISGSDYSYSRINTVGGNHTIRSNGGFIAYVYGFGHNESFGYATGASLGNLNVDFIVHDQNEATPIDSLCLGSEISFEPVADTIYTLFEYDFGDGNSFSTMSDTAVFHTYQSTGEYLVTMTASTGGDDCSNGNQEISRKLIHVIEPEVEIFGPRSVCPNTSDVAYFIEEEEAYSHQWFIDGGELNSAGKDSISVDWFGTNSEAGIKMLATNRYGCTSDTIPYPVKINIQLDPEAPFGPDTLCADAISDIPYYAYYTSVSTYQWETDFGTIADGNGTNEVKVDWDGYGLGNLWFHQISVTDTVCDGTSDTLLVYIQRNPSIEGEIITEQDTFMIGESFDISLAVDTLYQFANWEIDGKTVIDTVSTDYQFDHSFLCAGAHTIKAVAYDTGTVCSEIRAYVERTIHILPTPIEMISVSASASGDSSISITWKIKNAEHLPKQLYLYRKPIYASEWQLIAMLDPGQNSYTDLDVDIHQESYLYKIEVNQDCQKADASLEHRSVLLFSESDEEVANISWNDYEGWYGGVDHYEIWLSIDSGEYKLIETTSDLLWTYENTNDGFDFCFEIRAIERNGNNAFSRSNNSCVAFIPEIRTYNVITPNTSEYIDDYNEYFTIDNIEHYPNSKLTILNRYGKVVYETTGYRNNWNGKINGTNAPSGTYYYELELNEPRNELNSVRGFFSILY